MKLLDYVKYIKNNRFLKERKELEQEEIEKLIKKYRGVQVSLDHIKDFYPASDRNLKIYHFNGENINGYKSVVKGREGGSGESIYFLINYDDNPENPYGEHEGYEYWQDLTLFKDSFKDKRSMLYKIQKMYPNFDLTKYKDNNFSVSIPMKIYKSEIGISSKDWRKLKTNRTNGYFEFFPNKVKIWG